MASPEGPPLAKRLRGEEPPSATKAQTSEGTSTKRAELNVSNFHVQELMKTYYSKLFPHEDFYKWLAYGNDGKKPQADAGFFQRREFCFTLFGDIFVRYQSFKDGMELAAALRDRCPSKIDIGPVYNVDPSRRTMYTGLGSGSAFAPVERELVFDIDLTDYDDVRTCGEGAHVCASCWPLMAVAVQVLDTGLREDFGFENILWVFSGRRGIHCWVCDPKARRLTDEQRSSIAMYFTVYKGQEEGLAKLGLMQHDHPAIARAEAFLTEAWTQRLLPAQRVLESSEGQEAVLRYVPSEALRDTLRSRWAANRPRPGTAQDLNLQRWQELEQECQKAAKEAASTDKRLQSALLRAPQRIMFAYCYPRLDVEVSKKMNHLLKAPFCVHPKTGKVCTPIDPEAVWEFDPDAVPTVAQLIAQLGAAGSTAEEEAWRSTAMAEQVELFRRVFLQKLQQVSREDLIAKARVASAQPSFAW